MVAFRSTRPVGSRYSRARSLLFGLRVSKLYGRNGGITLNQTALRRSFATGRSRLTLPGFAKPRVSSDVSRLPRRDCRRTRARDEPRARRRRSAAHGRRVLEASADGVMDRRHQYDVVIIGSGAGGGTMAHALAGSSARILILERGDFIPQEAENWNRKRSGSTCAIRRQSAGSTSTAASSVRTRTTNVGGNTNSGQRPVPVAREDFQALEHMEGLVPRMPTITTRSPRIMSAPNVSMKCTASSAPIRPSRLAAPSTRRHPTRRSDGDDRRTAARAGAASISAAARHSRRLRALQHLQLVRVQGACEERGGCVLRASRSTAAER